MPSAWIERRTTGRGTRYRVKWRAGGREDVPRLAGTFQTVREAKLRRDWVAGELAAMRLPDLTLLAAPVLAPTVREACERWRETRVDVSEGTRVLHRVALGRAVKLLGDRRIDELTIDDVNGMVAELAKTRKRETIRKSVKYLAAVLDEHGVDPNPARDKRIRLPHETRQEIKPPTAAHVLAVHRLLSERYRLPLLVLDDTGMRLSELELLTWGDVDEPKGRWRVSAATSKTGRARWVKITPAVFQAVMALCPRDDRVPERRVFQGFGSDRFRTAIGRACTAAGIPAFSPHDLRHRRISLLLREEDPVMVSRLVGHARASMSLDVYGHVLIDATELDYERMLE